MWKKYLDKFMSIPRDRWILALLCGILLLVLTVPLPGGLQSGQNTEKKERESEEIAQTGEDTEQRLENILSRLEGAGRVKVMITQRTGSEKVVEKDSPSQERTEQQEESGMTRSSTDKSVQESTIYTRSGDGSEIPYVTLEIAPQIEGVLVLAQGGGNPVVVKNITEAVMALFGLDAHKIKVMKMQ
ncbi:MAG: stage III sporulation protein AG [Eubacteriales bacterium]|nr:stage III sporulation protein AG [Eubacteriales bacterium]